MEEVEFNDCWASVRQKLATSGQPDQLRDDAKALLEVARSETERLRAHAVLVQLGAQAADDDLRSRGLSGLRTISPNEIGGLFDLLPDFTQLGDPFQRWTVSQRALEQVGVVDDPGFSFRKMPSSEAAAELVRLEWRPPPSVRAGARNELLLQVGWAALELFIELNCVHGRQLLLSPGLRLPAPSEPGWWEHRLQRAILALADADECAAIGLIEGLFNARPPAWAMPRVRYFAAKYALLATDSVLRWITCAGSDVPHAAAANSATDKASMRITDMVLERVKTSPQRLVELEHELESHPWMTFGAFCNAGLKPSGRSHLASLLLRLPDVQFSELLWRGREQTFAQHLLDVEDHTDALRLALRALRLTGHDAVRRAIRDLVDRVEPWQLFNVKASDPELWSTLKEEAGGLSDARRMQIGRGGTYIAVVDGSNVMWGGLDRLHGGKPQLGYLLDTLSKLRRAGFDCVTFVDSKTVHELEPGEAMQLKNLQNRREVSIVGRADPQVIQTFLKSHDASEMVTVDQFRSERVEFPALESVSSAKWRKFHVVGKEVVFDRPLDQVPRP